MSEPDRKPLLAIIGGSGVYNIPGLKRTGEEAVESPFGEPSDQLFFGELDGQPLVFLPRHGRRHTIPPTDINFRANIDALKRVGVTEILSMSAVGSLREDLAPGSLVIIDEFVDRTVARSNTFFDAGIVAHVSMADPVCRRLGDHIEAAAGEVGVDVVRGGTYLVIEGPQFSSRAESALFRSWGMDVIGMTNLPEAKLAREAEICYATVAMVADFDCWHPHHLDVTVEEIMGVVMANAEKARTLIQAVAPRLRDRDGPCEAGCHRALDNAIVTDREARDPDSVKRLAAVAGRVLGS